MARKKKSAALEPVELDSKDAEKDSQKKKVTVENWASDTESDIYEKCIKMYPKIEKAYKNREEADESISEYWNIYNATPDENQVYQGNSKSYVPVVRDCINARAKRALKQNFSSKYKHVEAVGTDGETPHAQLALAEHYIRSTKLKSLCRSVLISGDVTGHWGIYVDWMRSVRNVSEMIRRNPVIRTLDGEEMDLINPHEEEEVVEDSEIIDEGPTVTDFAVEDLAVIPPTCNDIEKAEIVALKLRMSKEQIEKMVDDGIFILGEDSELSEWMDTKKGVDKRNPAKDRSDDAGIKTEGTNSYALIYEVTARLEFEKGKKSLAYIYFAGENDCIGIIKAPQWGQKRPYITAPIERVGGSFYGISKIEAVKWMQWQLIDFWNMGQDSAMYSMLPIIMTDPEKNPNYASMVIGLAAVWTCDPNSTRFAEMPSLWKDSIQMCQAIKSQIHESLDVNDLMMGKAPSGRKNAQAVGAQMQEASVPILDHAERFEEEILTPLIERFVEYDTQFREEDITVMSMGEIGMRAAMQVIPPQQWGNRYQFQWVGTEYVMNMQRMQQQISTMNVLRGIPPQQLNGKKLDITPILSSLVSTVFGEEMGQRILIDERDQHTVPADIENELMANGITVMIHQADNDVEHIQSHQMNAQKTGDPRGLERTHMEMHVKQLQAKRQAAMAAQQPQQPGQQGMPGGAGPGVAGTPRMGAQTVGPKAGQQPNGAIGPDQMAGGIPRG